MRDFSLRLTESAIPVRRRRTANSAFTLLEVLITAILLATLLAGVWSLYQTFAALYDTGFVQTERSLLMRSLNQQITEDLLATVAPLPEPPSSPGRDAGFSLPSMSQSMNAASCALRVGLVGTYNMLRLDILKTDAPTQEPPMLDELMTVTEDPPTGNTGEIATVLYTFVPPAVFERESSFQQSGLTRREIRINRSSAEDVRLVERLSEASSFSSSSSSDVGAVETSTDAGTMPMPWSGQPALPRTVTTVLPEVVALEFRYLDDQEWTDAWDSRSRHSLPRAVEVSFEVQLITNSKPRRTMVEGAPDPTPTATGPRRGEHEQHCGPPGLQPAICGLLAAISRRRSQRTLPPRFRLRGCGRTSSGCGIISGRATVGRRGAAAVITDLARRIRMGDACGRRRPRRAMVLIIVLIIVVMVSLAGFSFVATMHNEDKATRIRGDELQAEQLVQSGLETVLLTISSRVQDGATEVLSPPEERYRGVLVLDDPDRQQRGRFTVLSPRVEGDQVVGYRYGPENESAKLNLVALLRWEQRQSEAGRQALMQLPNMTESIADAILDWVDTDDAPRSVGAESEFYGTLEPPYSGRNGSPDCLDELLLAPVSRGGCFLAAMPTEIIKLIPKRCLRINPCWWASAARKSIRSCLGATC